MNLTSFFANKCFEYLLKCDAQNETGQSGVQLQPSSKLSLTSQFSIQPPWSSDSKTFRSLCNGCGNCISACENSILILSKSGYPQVDFSRGSCNFCGACAKNCPQEVLMYEPARPPWDLHVKINSQCLTRNNVVCSTCVEQCDKEAITIPRIIDNKILPHVLTDLCDGCGACFKACPVNAIEIRQKEPRTTLTSEESL
jgi:ferredoxin-type protein NapF